ncbi:MAG: hypothetical protein A2146_06485 [Actinobacteria bacterium RBG_16_67_10]|jgi:prevent-host-death family protein|nr:MAG: hypothetical protein A2146_06485 [Actinobacteria bacterium RBG_16_67_10]
MPDITATEAARRLSDVLDSVEHDGEHYTIVRRGKPIARLEPVAHGHGADVLDLLSRHPADPAWADQLVVMRSLLEIERHR